MAKSYERELDKLKETYEWALQVDISSLVKFVESSINTPLITVGSGGSYSVGVLTSILHQEIANVSIPLTPLEVQSYNEHSLKGSSIIFFTAGGNNSDINAALKRAIKVEHRNIFVLCMKSRSEISSLVANYDHIQSSIHDPPAGKDGFLATNSLLAMSTLILRAYSEVSNSFRLPNNYNELIPELSISKKFQDQFQDIATQISKRDTLIVLYGKWGKPAAFDAESKLTESGLINARLSDYRNFAHGRHYWITAKKLTTSLVSFSTPDDSYIADRTLKLIPEQVPIMDIHTENSGPLGALSLVLYVFYLVNLLAINKQVDPGKPNVEDFGRKLYHLEYKSFQKIPPGIRPKFSNEEVAVSRKIGNTYFAKDYSHFWHTSYIEFINRLTERSYSSIILDYDGTLVSQKDRFSGISKSISYTLTKLLERRIIVGIATGRGKSVREDLIKKIPEKFHDQVYLAYYNGGEISVLSDPNHPDKNLKPSNDFQKLASEIQNVTKLGKEISYTIRAKQITINIDHAYRLNSIWELVNEASKRLGFHGVQVLKSKHSIDIIEEGVSKLNLTNTIHEILKGHDRGNTQTLCIGDNGQWPGNDFFMLSTPYSLSVDSVSLDPSSCWNLAPLGNSGVNALEYYFGMLELHDFYFRVKLDKTGETKFER